MTDALPTKLPPALKRKDVQMVAGAALLGLAAGLYIGIKLARPVQWVPPVGAAPTPCHDCDERNALAEQNGQFTPLTAEEKHKLVQAIASVEADKAAARDLLAETPQAEPVPADG